VNASPRTASLAAATASLLVRAVEPAAQRLLVLIYHRVLPAQDPLAPREMTAEVFRWQMRLLREHAAPLAVDEALARLQARSLPRRAVCVTFDDGYADNERVALPILREFGVPALFFVTTGFLDGGRMWNDSLIEAIRRLPAGDHDLSPIGLEPLRLDGDASRMLAARSVIGALKHLEPQQRAASVQWLEDRCGRELPRDLMMTSAQVQALHASGMTIGAHTVTHPILTRLTDEAAAHELRESRVRLESLLRTPVRYFAYPNGRPGDDYGDAHVELARACGYDAAFSTRRGACTPDSDRWQLPRFTPWDRTPPRWIARLVLELRNAQ
jgi:peptidoglycan/xylan/chitin deacetylase (PgdA/CDA1 family)